MWLIVGAGAIGGLLAAGLAAAGERVGVLARPERARTLSAQGLHVTGLPRGPVRGQPEIISDPEARFGRSGSGRAGTGERPDLVVFCVKAYATADAARRLHAVLGDDVPVLSLQNGLGNEEELAAHFRCVLGGAVTISAEARGPGAVHVYNPRGGVALPLADWAGQSAPAAVGRLGAALARAGFRVRILATSRDIKWSKLLLNLMGNATAALTGMAPGQVFADVNGFAVERRVMREALAVMDAAGARRTALPGMPVGLASWLAAWAPAPAARAVLARKVGGRRGNKRPSLLADLQAGRRRSEAEWLYGAVAARGRDLGRPAPVNQRLRDLLLRAYAGDPGVARFLGRPDLLAEAVLS